MTEDQRLIDLGPASGVPVESFSGIARVRRFAARAAAGQAFCAARARLLDQVAVEMATHLVTQEEGGRMQVRLADWTMGPGVELLLSTASTAPFGAAGVRAALSASDLFEIYTAPGMGTEMIAQLGAGLPADPAGQRYLVGWMSDPIENELVSGDAWAVDQRGARFVALVADGLGHGEEAAAASEAAVAAFRAHLHEPVERIAARLHDALRVTRGAAIALAEVDTDAEEVRFCGIGNVVARLLLADRTHELISQFGIAGYQQAPQMRTFTRSWPRDAMLVMHSDGLSSSWSANSYPDLRHQHPQLVASTVMRDAARAHDDALVIVLSGTDAGSRSQRSEAG